MTTGLRLGCVGLPWLSLGAWDLFGAFLQVFGGLGLPFELLEPLDLGTL